MSSLKLKKRVQTKLFCQEWLQVEEYKHWLRNVISDPTKFKCIAYNSILTCGKSELTKHNLGPKHTRKSNVKGLHGCMSMTSFIKSNEQSENSKKEIINIKTAEIKLFSFFATNNIAFQTVDLLVPVLKQILPDSKIVEKVQLHRKKYTSIVKNIIAPVETYDTVSIIKNCHFSTLVDESTDISMHKFLCILVRYVQPDSGVVHTRLLELLPVNATDCRASKLYEEFKQCFASKNISLSNLISVASDGANVMVGKHNSFFTHLKRDNPDLILMQCICHSAPLAASKASQQLPRSPEDLIIETFQHISLVAQKELPY